MSVAAGGPRVKNTDLCITAVSDALHDFDASMVDKAKTVIPDVGRDDCASRNEDTLIHDILGITRYSSIHPEPKERNTFNVSASPFMTEYTYTLCTDPADMHTHLSGIFPNTNIMCVVDIYNEMFKESLKSASNGNNTNYLWVQNKQTIYDPAIKTTIDTDAGKEIFNRNRNVFFAFERTKPVSSLMHKKWDNRIDVINPISEEGKESLFYSLYDVTQVLTVNGDEKDYTNYDSYTTLYNRDTREHVVADVSIAKKTASVADYASYTFSYPFIRKHLYEHFGTALPDAMTPVAYEDILSKYHCLFKRLGDQGQAISCLYPMSLYYMQNDAGRTVNEIESTGYNCFVTGDRPAFVASMLYRVPIIVFCYSNNTLGIFVKKSIIDPRLQFNNYKNTYITKYNSIIGGENSLQNRFMYMNALFPIYKALLFRHIANIISEYSGKISAYTAATTHEIKNNDYRLFVKNIFNHINNLYTIIDIIGKIEDNIHMPADRYPLPESIYAYEYNIRNNHNIKIYVNNIINKYNEINNHIYSINTIINSYNIMHNGQIMTIQPSNYEHKLYTVLNGHTVIGENVHIDKIIGICTIHSTKELDTMNNDNIDKADIFSPDVGSRISSRGLISAINEISALPYLYEISNLLHTDIDIFSIWYNTIAQLMNHILTNYRGVSGFNRVQSIRELMVERLFPGDEISGIVENYTGERPAKRRREGGYTQKGGNPVINEIKQQFIQNERNIVIYTLYLCALYNHVNIHDAAKHALRESFEYFDTSIYNPRIIHGGVRFGTFYHINFLELQAKYYDDIYRLYKAIDYVLEGGYKIFSDYSLPIQKLYTYEIPSVRHMISKPALTYAVKSVPPGGNEMANNGEPPGGGNGRPRGIGKVSSSYYNAAMKNKVISPGSGKMPFHPSDTPTIARSAAAPGGNENNERMLGGRSGSVNGGSYKPRKIQYKSATRKQKPRVKKTHKQKRV